MEKPTLLDLITGSFRMIKALNHFGRVRLRCSDGKVLDVTGDNRDKQFNIHCHSLHEDFGYGFVLKEDEDYTPMREAFDYKFIGKKDEEFNFKTDEAEITWFRPGSLDYASTEWHIDEHQVLKMLIDIHGVEKIINGFAEQYGGSLREILWETNTGENHE